MKFLLLFYKTGRLRVVVTSANMRSADWYIMDNVSERDFDMEREISPLNINIGRPSSYRIYRSSLCHKANSYIPGLPSSRPSFNTLVWLKRSNIYGDITEPDKVRY
jgi:hypothetical protein